MFGFWRKARNRVVIERLHDDMVQAARQPAFYTSMGVADDFEGRFDLLVLHAALITHRLMALPSKGSDMAQDLTDLMFARFDVALREMGVGDLAVPKRIKKLAEAYLGRRKAYEEVFVGRDDEALAAVLARNVLGRADVDQCSRALARYTRQAQSMLDGAQLLVFEQGPLVFPDASAFCEL
jgi:cytochrome b pre-mRNA-processing protein 3